MCTISAREDCQCGKRKEVNQYSNRNGNQLNVYLTQTRIVGGVETSPNEYRMMAGLIQSPTIEVYCGATIIARNYALTAAHCLTRRTITDLGLLCGDQDYRSSNYIKN